MSDFSQMSYSLREGQEDVPANEKVIEKRGHVISFTPEQWLDIDKQNKKAVEEIDAKRRVSVATIENIERNHPFIKDLTEEQIITAHLYAQAKADEKVCVEKLAEFSEHQEKAGLELAEIIKQIPEVEPALVLTVEETQKEIEDAEATA